MSKDKVGLGVGIVGEGMYKGCLLSILVYLTFG